MARIRRVSYRSGFVKRVRDATHLPAITFESADLPEDVVALVDAHLLDLGGSYGVPEAGDPIQYDELHIEHDQGEVEIVVYNRAILLFMTDSEAVKWIHQVCCRLDDIAGSALRRSFPSNFRGAAPSFLGIARSSRIKRRVRAHREGRRATV
jgi:hypothetical protein